MNGETSGMRSGGINRTDSPSSGSQVSNSNELPVKFVTEISAMDYEMKTLENKIKSKKEEEERLLEAKNTNLSSLSSVRKQLNLLQDRERSFNKSLNRVKGSNTALEGLELAVIQNLKAMKISNEEETVKCNNVIKRFSAIINSHQETFCALPWVKEKKLLSVGVEKKRIILGRLKIQQQEDKGKLRLLQRISEKRQRIEILRLSILMIEREKCMSEEREKVAKKRWVEQEILSLEQQKRQVQEQITSRTQEMILRIMNRSNDRPKKPLDANVATNTGTHDEINKSAAPSIKDRLGIRKIQPAAINNSAAVSIRDRLGISKKQRNVTDTPPASSHVGEDGKMKSSSLLEPNEKAVVLKHTGENSAGSSTSAENKGAPESFETNRKTIVSEDVELNNKSCKGLKDQTPSSSSPQLLQDTTLTDTDESASPVTASILQRPPPLKAILKQSSSLAKKNSLLQKIIPAPTSTPPRFEDEAASTTKDNNSSTFHPLSTRDSEIPPQDACDCVSTTEKMLMASDSQQPDPAGAENITDAPAPKKPRVTGKMPPPLPTPAPQRQQPKKKPNQPSKTPKKVSFKHSGDATHEVESSLGQEFTSQRSTMSNQSPQPEVVVQEMEGRESPPKQTAPVSEFVEPDNVSSNKTPASQLPPSSQKENQTNQPTNDEFRHLFSPTPQQFSETAVSFQQQTTPGNFDSIFGAIFNTPDASKDNAGFQFNLQDPTEKENTSKDVANPSSNTGQDFFSFFGTPQNADEAKKSYTNNFFKLF